MGEDRVYTKYVVRDRDGEVVQRGRIYPLRRAVELNLVGKDASMVRIPRDGCIVGPYVFHPEIQDCPTLRVEIF